MADKERISQKSFIQNFCELFTSDDLKTHEWVAFTSLSKFLLVLWYIAFVRNL